MLRPSRKGPSEEELSELLARLVYSTMASMPNWQIVSESEVKGRQSIPALALICKTAKDRGDGLR